MCFCNTWVISSSNGVEYNKKKLTVVVNPFKSHTKYQR